MRTLLLLSTGLAFMASACAPNADEADTAAATPEPNEAAISSPGERPPNIVLIIGDDHGWPYYGFLGDENVVTPHLDALAERSVVFELAHSSSNYCRPTLQSLVTGLYPSQYMPRMEALAAPILAEDEAFQAAQGRERHARRTIAESSRIEEFQTLPRVLAEHGYASFQGGKWWEQSYAHGGFTHGMSEGFAWSDMMTDGGFFEFMGGRGIELGRTTMDPVLDFISDHADQPFFVWYGPALPHTPLNPPAEHRAHYEVDGFSESARDYYGNITWFDHGIGQVIAQLDAEGVLDNTIIAYVNDNGWEQPADEEYLGDHDLYSNGGRRGKSSLFDTAFRTPILFSWPGEIDPARDTETLVNAVDIVPTLLDLVDIEGPDGLPGYSLEPIFEGQAYDGRDYLIGRTDSLRGDSDPMGNPVGVSEDLMGRDIVAYYLRSHRWHFVWIPADETLILYDLLNDPDATTNVAEQNGELIAHFREEIDTWRAQYVEYEGGL